MEIKNLYYEKLCNQPFGTKKVILLKQLIVPRYMKETKPAKWKEERAYNYYNDYGRVDKPLLVEKVKDRYSGRVKYILRDDYTRWMVLNFYGVKVPIRFE